MKKKRIGNLLLITVLAVFLLHAGTLSAAESSPENGWEFATEVYLWGAGIDGHTATDSEVNISFGDLIDNLEMAFMGTVGARKDKWSFLVDVIYLDVKGEKTIDSIGASVELRGWIVTPDVGYTVLSDDWGNLDLHVGARYLSLDSDIRLGPIGTDKSADVWDGIIGIRGRINLTEKLYMPYYLDIGAGDSKMTWQALAGLGYQFKYVDVVAGYRYMEWDFDDNSVFDDLSFSGPYGGLKYYF